MSRRRLQSNYGLFYPSSPIPLQGGGGVVTTPTGPYGGTYTGADYGGADSTPVTPPPPPPAGTYPWRAFSATTSPWNVKIEWLAQGLTTSGLGRTPAQLWGGTGHAWVSNEQAGAFIFHEDANSISWQVYDARNNRTLSLRAPSNFGPADNQTDYNAQLFTASGVAWDFYQLTINSRGSASCAGAASTSLTGTGVGTYGSATKVGFRAANFPWSAGCITLDDWTNGVIPHALVVALAGDDLQNGYLFPATAQDKDGYPAGGVLPQGALMGIKPTTPKPSLSAIGSMVWDAARDYGIYVGDRTGGWAFVGDYSPQKRLPGSVVDPLRYAPYDGDKVVAALVRVTGGKPSIPYHN